MIKHLVTYNALGEPIYCYSLTKKEIKEWGENQTDEQKKLTDWLKRVVNKGV